MILYLLFSFAIITNPLRFSLQNKVKHHTIHAFHPYINRDEETNFVKLLHLNRNNSGFDETYKKNETLDHEILFRIKINLIKFTLLKQLYSHHIGEPVKLELIHDNRDLFTAPTYSINLSAGGLYKDWDFS